MKLTTIRNILVCLSIFVFGFGLGGKVNNGSATTNNYPLINSSGSQSLEKPDLSLFWDVWGRVTHDFIDKKAIDPQKMINGAISGMVSSLGDPYTVFLTPEQNKETKEELGGSFDGIGAQLGIKDKKIVVISPISGTPAEKAGLRPNDWIVKIDDKETFDLTLPEAVSKIRGKKGTKVKLSIYRALPKDTSSETSASASAVPSYNTEEKPMDFEIVRDTILIKSVELDYKDAKNGKKVAHLKLLRFGDDTNGEWNNAVSEVVAKYKSGQIGGLILDVRNNPGGYLSGSSYIGSEFLKGGNVVLVENSSGDKKPYPVERVGKLIDIPLVVLINEGSASASEIVAGALQDRGRAKLVGTKSFGKGSVQEVQELSGGAGLHITTSKWLLPSGKWINGTGLMPDYPVEMNDKNPEADPQLDKALEVLP